MSAVDLVQLFWVSDFLGCVYFWGLFFGHGSYLLIGLLQKHETWYSGNAPQESFKKYTTQLPGFHNINDACIFCAKIGNLYAIFKEP